MHRLRSLIALLSLLIATTAHAQNTDAARKAFADGTAAFNEGSYASALEDFRAARDLGLTGPAVHYNIAVASYKLGAYDDAGEEFAYIADNFPAMRALAEYNLGLVARRLEHPQQAEQHFRRALESNPDETLRRLAERQLALPAETQKDKWYGLIEFTTGNDDNVRLVSNDVPLPSGVAAESRFNELTAVWSGPISSDPGFRFDGNIYAVRYADASFFDQDYVQLGFVYQWQFSQWQAEGGPHVSRSSLDGETYEKRTGAAIRLRRSLNSRLSFGVRYNHDAIDAGASVYSYVEGSSDSVELRLDRQQGNGRLTLGYAFESNDRGSTIAAERNKLALRYRYSFSNRWLVDWQASLRRSNYDHVSVPRVEDLTALSVALTRNLTDGWAVTGSIVDSHNSADFPFSYDRTRFDLGFNKTFY